MTCSSASIYKCPRAGSGPLLVYLEIAVPPQHDRS